jgi:adenine-specific DNA-methyltransferase
MAKGMNEPEKVELTSMDVAAQKREELKLSLGAAFPEVFAEDSIDFDQLKRVLGEWVDPSKERFGLNWAGKADCMKVIQQPSIATLKPDRDASVNFDDTENLFIEGDNLEVLKLLQKSYFGKIKTIYIDPPYNTGKEFIYPDKFAENIDTYLEYTSQVDDNGKRFSTNTDTSGRYHSRWLSMMYPRLYLARNLLRQDGAIFISIDDHEVMNLRSMCDHIFGEENHVATISILNNLKGRNDKKNVATCHEYLVVYGNEDFESFGIPLTFEQLAEYKHKDANGNSYALRDLRKRGGADKRADRPKLYFPIYFDESRSKCSLTRISESDVEILPKLGDGSDGCWRWGTEKIGSNLDILHPKYNRSKDRWGVEHRIYLDPTVVTDLDEDEADDEDISFERTSKSKSFWWGADISTDFAVRAFKDLFKGMGTDYPKSPRFLKRILQMSTKDNDIVLDFFGGFSTTAQAVMQLNQEDGASRQFIMVQLPEICDENSEPAKAGYKTISELSMERIGGLGVRYI